MKIIKFYTPWCNPCKVLTRMLQEVDLTGHELIEVDAEAYPETAAQYDVHSVPVLVFEKDGQEVERLVGMQPVERVIEVLEG